MIAHTSTAGFFNTRHHSRPELARWPEEFLRIGRREPRFWDGYWQRSVKLFAHPRLLRYALQDADPCFSMMAPNGITEYIVARWRGEQRVCVRNQSISQLMRTTRSLIKTPLHSCSGLLFRWLFSLHSPGFSRRALSGKFLHTSGDSLSRLPFFSSFARALLSRRAAHFFLGFEEGKNPSTLSRPPNISTFLRVLFFHPPPTIFLH